MSVNAVAKMIHDLDEDDFEALALQLEGLNFSLTKAVSNPFVTLSLIPTGSFYAYKMPFIVDVLGYKENEGEEFCIVKIGVSKPGNLCKRLSSTHSPGEQYMLKRNDDLSEVKMISIGIKKSDEEVIQMLCVSGETNADVLLAHPGDIGQEDLLAEKLFGEKLRIGKWENLSRWCEDKDKFRNGQWKAVAWRAWIKASKEDGDLTSGISAGWGESEFYLMKSKDFLRFKKNIYQYDPSSSSYFRMKTDGKRVNWRPSSIGVEDITAVVIKRWADDKRKIKMSPL